MKKSSSKIKKTDFTKEYILTALNSVINIILLFYFSDNPLALSIIGMETTIIFIYILGSLNQKLPKTHFLKKNAPIIFTLFITIIILLIFYLFYTISIATGAPAQDILQVIAILALMTILPVYYLIYRIFKKKK